MKADVRKKLDSAVYDTIVVLGIGGFVSVREFKHAFGEIDAKTFAKIMYATDQMLEDFDGTEATNPANISPTIAKYDFEEERHFSEVMELFRKHFGSGVVHLG